MYKNTIKTLAILGMVLLPELYLFASETLTIGVFPRRNPAVTVKMFTPLIRHIESETGMSIRLETAKNFPDFWKRVKQKRYDVVHYNQLHYILSTKFGYEIFAKNEEFGRSSLAPAILVRKDSGINTISDLKNKTIIFGGGELAMVAYVGNKILLHENGLSLQDYKTLVARNPPNATMAVYLGQVDAAGIGSVGLEIPIIRKKINTDELKFLAYGDTFPHIPWAFAEHVENKTREKIRTSFLNIGHSKKGKTVLRKAGLTGILSANDEEYNKIKVVYKQFQEYSGK